MRGELTQGLTCPYIDHVYLRVNSPTLFLEPEGNLHVLYTWGVTPEFPMEKVSTVFLAPP